MTGLGEGDVDGSSGRMVLGGQETESIELDVAGEGQGAAGHCRVWPADGHVSCLPGRFDQRVARDVVNDVVVDDWIRTL